MGGIGMGLTIVKKHVEQLHGTITVESRLHHGTSFRILNRKNRRRLSARDNNNSRRYGR
ncbi:MAG: ATP-binding protein [Candidatus Binatia bacterium]